MITAESGELLHIVQATDGIIILASLLQVPKVTDSSVAPLPSKTMNLARGPKNVLSL